MKLRKCFGCGFLIILFLNMSHLDPSSKADSATLEVTSPVLKPPDLRVFPRDLYCDKADNMGTGPSWQNITIGITKLAQLEQKLSAESDYSSGTLDDGTFFFTAKVLTKREAGVSISGCASGGVVQVLSILLPLQAFLKLKDFVADFGIPDAVTWTATSPTSRVVFWFQSGIAVETSAYDDEPYDGSIFRVVYFPYQKIAGYQARWPFNKTRSATFPIPELGQPEGKQNPFDFAAMIATMTAVPSR